MALDNKTRSTARLKENFTAFVPESFLRKTQIMQKENFPVVFTFLVSFCTIIELHKSFKNSTLSTRVNPGIQQAFLKILKQFLVGIGLKAPQNPFNNKNGRFLTNYS